MRNLSHVTNKYCVLVFFHGFGFSNDIHNLVQSIDHISPPEVQYQQGAGAIKHSFVESNQYLQENFSNQQDSPVIIFPPKQLTKTDESDRTYVQRLVKRLVNTGTPKSDSGGVSFF